MRALGFVLAMLCAGLNAGCYVVSLHGLADDRTTVTDDTVVGRWYGTDDDIELTITPDEWRTYSVVLQDRTGEQRFTARLTDAANKRFFDLTVHAGQETLAALLPVHLVGRFTITGETLSVEVLDYDWFRGRFDRGSLTLPTVMDERDTLIVSADRTKFRDWLIANAGSSALFEEAMVFSKKPSGSR